MTRTFYVIFPVLGYSADVEIERVTGLAGMNEILRGKVGLHLFFETSVIL